MDKLRVVLFDLQTAGHHIKYVLYLAQYLCEKGYEVAFVTLKEDNRTKLLSRNEPGLIIQFLDNNTKAQVKRNFVARHLQMIGALEKCFEFANEWKADVVSIMQLDYNELAVMAEVLRWKNPGWQLFGFLVWPYFLYNSDGHVSLLRKAYYNLTAVVAKHLLKKGTLGGMFVHTKEIKQALVKRFGWEGSGLEKTIVVVPDPAEMFHGCCSAREARERLRLPIGMPILLFFGGLRWDKGPDFLLEAIRNIEDRVVLVIAGQPDYVTDSDILAVKKQLETPGRIISRIGYIPEEEVRYYFLAADAVILPYRRAFKGTSGILQNAAAAGKPVIATDVGEIGRIVREYSLGIVVEPESSDLLAMGIEEFLARKESLQEEVHTRALQYAKLHNCRIMARKVWEAYNIVAGE